MSLDMTHTIELGPQNRRGWKDISQLFLFFEKFCFGNNFQDLVGFG